MKILFNASHPAHVHLLKNAIWDLEKRGHACKITTVDKEVALQLLRAYGFEYEVVGSAVSSLASKAFELVKIESRLYSISRVFKPDILVGGVGNAYIAHVGRLIGKPSIVFDDTEHARVQHLLTDPFATAICTPSCYRTEINGKQIRYDGYHELAYLHPNRFTPNPTVLDELGLTPEDPYIVLRFVSWEASHDVGHTGLTLATRRRAVREFEKYGRILISSEKPLTKEFEQYRVAVSPEKMHDLLYYATLLYGESATMASECAVLGTHAIFCDFAGRGYTDEEETRYGLVHNFRLDATSQRRSIERAVELLRHPDLKEIGRKKRAVLLKDKIDVTAFMVWFIENFPQSIAGSNGKLNFEAGSV